MVRFDRADAVPEWVAAHLEGCADCRAFAAVSERAREEIGGIPLPVPDGRADREVLAALGIGAAAAGSHAQPGRSPVRVTPATRGAEVLKGLLSAGRRRAALPLAVAGVCSFGATLLVAGWLSASPGGPAEAPPLSADVPSASRRVSADLESRLDAWLARPSPTALPPQPAELPAPPGPRAPAHPVQRSQRARSGPSA